MNPSTIQIINQLVSLSTNQNAEVVLQNNHLSFSNQHIANIYDFGFSVSLQLTEQANTFRATILPYLLTLPEAPINSDSAEDYIFHESSVDFRELLSQTKIYPLLSQYAEQPELDPIKFTDENDFIHFAEQIIETCQLLIAAAGFGDLNYEFDMEALENARAALQNSPEVTELPLAQKLLANDQLTNCDDFGAHLDSLSHGAFIFSFDTSKLYCTKCFSPLQPNVTLLADQNTQLIKCVCGQTAIMDDWLDFTGRSAIL